MMFKLLCWMKFRKDFIVAKGFFQLLQESLSTTLPLLTKLILQVDFVFVNVRNKTESSSK